MFTHTRGYLPHIEVPHGTYFITFRLEDSLPVPLLAKWKEELSFLKKRKPLDLKAQNQLEQEYQRKIEAYLDGCNGRCWLKDPKIAVLADGALRYFNGQRYHLHTWTIMPNHVHVLLTASDPSGLGRIVHSWKSFTAHAANKLLGLTGEFWQREYFDRLIRSQRQFEFAARYTLNNPVKAGLCKQVYDWPWKGCSQDLMILMKRFGI